MCKNPSKNDIRPQGEYTKCENCDAPTNTADLADCLGYQCCPICRQMTRVIARNMGVTVKSLPSFAQTVMRKAAQRTQREPAPLQLTFDQLFARKGAA